MHRRAASHVTGKHFKSESAVLILGGNKDILGRFSFNMPVVSGAVLSVIPGLVWLSILHALLVSARISLWVHQLLPTLRQNDY